MGSVLVNVTCIGKNWFFFQSEHQLTVKIPLRNDVDFINSSTFFFSGSPSYLGICHEHNDFLTLKMNCMVSKNTYLNFRRNHNSPFSLHN